MPEKVKTPDWLNRNFQCHICEGGKKLVSIGDDVTGATEILQLLQQNINSQNSKPPSKSQSRRQADALAHGASDSSVTNSSGWLVRTSMHPSP